MGVCTFWGFPDSSVGKKSACDARDPSSIPGLGRSTGEGIRYPLQYSCTSLVAQLVKNTSVMWETWVQSLGWEDPLEKGKAAHSSILAWRIPWIISPWCHEDSVTTEGLPLSLVILIPFTPSSNPQSSSFFFVVVPLYLGASCLVFYILHLSEIVRCLSFSNLVYLA